MQTTTIGFNHQNGGVNLQNRGGTWWLVTRYKTLLFHWWDLTHRYSRCCHPMHLTTKLTWLKLYGTKTYHWVRLRFLNRPFIGGHGSGVWGPWVHPWNISRPWLCQQDQQWMWINKPNAINQQLGMVYTTRFWQVTEDGLWCLCFWFHFTITVIQ